MNTIRAYLLLIATAACLALVGCNHTSNSKAYVLSTRFGLMKPDGSIRETATIPRISSTDYAWELDITGGKGTLLVKEVYRLPESAEWGTRPLTNSSRLKHLRSEIVDDGATQIDEFEVTHDETTTLRETYSVSESDPIGTHNISIYVEGELFDTISFDLVDSPSRNHSALESTSESNNE